MTAVVLGTAAAGLLVVQAGLLARTVDQAFLGRQPLHDLVPLLVAVCGLAGARALLGWLGECAAARASARTRHKLRTRLVGAVHAAGPAFAGSRPAGALSAVIVDGVESTDAFVSQYLPQLALAVLVPLVVGVAVTVRDPLSGAVLWLTFPLIPLFMFLIGGYAQAETERQWTTLVRLRARVLDAIQGLPTAKAFGAARLEAAVVREAGASFRDVTMRVLRVAFVSALVLELLATLGVAIVAVEIGLRLLYGRLSFGPALAVLVLAPEFYRPLRALGAAFHAGMAGKEAARAIDAVETEARQAAARSRDSMHPGGVAGRPDARPVPSAGPPRLRFERVRYTYPGRRDPALADVSLEIPPGTTLALVGPSGAGKTTLAHLTLGLLRPDAGTIRVEDIPLAALDHEAWRARIAWVPQRPRLFHGSLGDNLRLARPEATTDALMRALTLARADDLARDLPRGLDTPVGERGERLSGGQAQRVALARAFLRDAPVLVLDEPTAQLDPEHDAALTATIRTLCRGRTVLLIAHRLQTVREVDRIVVLDGGRVAESGTHTDLLASGGHYARLLAARGVER